MSDVSSLKEAQSLTDKCVDLPMTTVCDCQVPGDECYVKIFFSQEGSDF